MIGSGFCVFSRYPILDTFLYQYSLNGYPYMVSAGGQLPQGLLMSKSQAGGPLQRHCDCNQPSLSPLLSRQLQHGDWFCGKAVGLLIIKICGIIFHVYVTHVSLTAGKVGERAEDLTETGNHWKSTVQSSLRCLKPRGLSLLALEDRSTNGATSPAGKDS